MVRFMNKDLKAHTHSSNELISEIIDSITLHDLTKLFVLHINNFSEYSNDKLNHLINKLDVQLGIDKNNGFYVVLTSTKNKTKDLFLVIELILESFYSIIGSYSSYFNDFLADLNDFFLIHKLPLQIRYFPQKKEFYIEKIISQEISEEIKNTLENFSKEEKVFEDFKESIKKYSSGNYEGSIEKCCISIEDYLCIILEKETCSGVDSYYNDASKLLKIPQDLNDRFSNLVKYIHKYRSNNVHGSMEKVEIPEPELTTQAIIQFTMIILNYLKKKRNNLV
jgi:hypothetical protein